MAFCPKCGAQVADDAPFCADCGEALGSAAPKQEKAQFDADFIKNLNNTPDTTADYDPTDIQNNKLMAVLAYLGLLVLIPLFLAKESKFARYHCNQGLLVDIASVAVSIISTIVTIVLPILGILFWLIELAIFAVQILGIINVVNGKAKELPIIGKFKFLK